MNYFFIAGAQRSGTTFLYNLLDRHPEIAMAKPLRPEPKFFINDLEFEKGAEFYLNKYFPDIKFDKSIKCIGEKSASYFEFDFVPQRVQSLFPKAKCIIVLRNPVDRAISNYYFTLKHNLETRTLKEVFIDELPPPVVRKKISVSPFAYKERGNYSTYLPIYKQAFGNRLKVVLFEHLISNEEVKSEIWEFLEVTSMPFSSETCGTNSNDKYDLITDDLIMAREKLQVYYSKEQQKLRALLKNDFSIWERK